MLNPNLMKFHLTITYITVAQSFWKFAQSTAVIHITSCSKPFIIMGIFQHQQVITGVSGLYIWNMLLIIIQGAIKSNFLSSSFLCGWSFIILILEITPHVYKYHKLICLWCMIKESQLYVANVFIWGHIILRFAFPAWSPETPIMPMLRRN